ncbi:MAG: ATP-binding protein, partial [Nocardioides sp.]
MSEWSVRRKVVAVLALPVILAAVFGGLRVRTELTSASDYSANQQHATVLGPAIAYLDATERLAVPPTLAAEMDPAGDSPTKGYAKALAALKAATAGAQLTPVQQGYVNNIVKIGEQLKSGSGTGITATAPVQLGDMTRDASSLVTSTLDTNGAPDQRTQALVEALNARLSLVKQQLLIQGSTQSAASLLDSVWLAAEIGVEGQALQSIKGIGNGGYRLNNLIASNGTRLGQATTEKAANLGAAPSTFKAYDGMTQVLLDRIGAGLATNASTAKTRALTDSAIILLALLASLVLALLLAGALIRPLRKLRAGAHEVAHEKLPETVRRIRDGEEPDEFTPIPVQTHEELGQLARAVDDMHRQAVTLATGEAQLRSQVGAMFVTLSRRNTTLVNQQLALIESLEQDEEDPQRLEQLFALDHLATRMRRTAESLVILGGTSGRAASFEELSVSDIVHAAVSEVQDYQRVRIDAAPDRMVSGRAASDIVHLMAELIDNALSYSPPGSPVLIQASEDNGRVEIEIIDSGLGMAGDALAKANDSLKRGGEVTVDTARRMGLFVVSRLAEEHALKVKLRRNANGGGIIATITLPATVLVSDEPVEHVSLMDAPAQVEEPEVYVEPEPDEEYDPYLERIEEAIAAVTGLPRRRPGLNVEAPEPVPTPAASVSMFGAASELPAGYEPTPLPGMADADSSSGSEESEPAGATALSEALPTESADEPSVVESSLVES